MPSRFTITSLEVGLSNLGNAMNTTEDYPESCPEAREEVFIICPDAMYVLLFDFANILMV